MKNFCLFIAASCLATALIVPAAHAGANPKGRPFIAINDQIIEVKGSISSLQEQIDILVGRVDSVEQRLTANQAAIVDLNEQNAALQALINNNLSSIEDINGEISLLKTDNENLKLQIAAYAEGSSQIDDLQSQVDNNNALIASLEGAILMVQEDVISLGASLQSQIENNYSLIGGLQDQVNLINQTLETKQKIIDGVCPDGSAVQQINSDGSVACGAAGGGISGQLQSTRVYLGMVAGPGRTVEFGVSCPDGYASTSAGVSDGSGWDIAKLNTSPDDHPYYPNGALLTATNKNNYTTWITVIASCMRIAP